MILPELPCSAWGAGHHGKTAPTRRAWPATAALALALGATPAASAQSAAGLYQAKCAVCHGADERGDTPAGRKLGTPDLHSPQVAGSSDAALAAAFKESEHKGKAHKGKLADEQISDVVKYVKTLK